MGGYLWSDENPAGKRRVAGAMALLAASKAANVSVPFAFKYAIDGLSAQAGMATSGVEAMTHLPMTAIAATPAVMLVGVRGAASVGEPRERTEKRDVRQGESGGDTSDRAEGVRAFART